MIRSWHSCYLSHVMTKSTHKTYTDLQVLVEVVRISLIHGESRSVVHHAHVTIGHVEYTSICQHIQATSEFAPTNYFLCSIHVKFNPI